jgi:hypothetical protein
VHLIRHSLTFVSWKDRKPVMPALRAIYRAADAEAGLKALEAFEAGPWGEKYPAIAMSWRRNWEHVVPFFAFPEGVRRIIYTTDDIDKRLVGSCGRFALHGRPRGEERRLRMKAPSRSHYRRSSLVASVRRFGPRGRQCRTVRSYARSACSAEALSRSRSSLTL